MRIESTIKGFEGHVITPDFMNITQVRAFEDAYFGDLNTLKDKIEDSRVFVSVSDERLLPFLIEFVKEWKIENVPKKPTLETFPQTPRRASHDLIMTIAQRIFEMWRGEAEVPNA